ncbi:MAG: hypothetical protein K8S97_11140 [Anaerolineae bacterium]|nr:hypothetical protein [Anaerolineae bacterium]
MDAASWSAVVVAVVALVGSMYSAWRTSRITLQASEINKEVTLESLQSQLTQQEANQSRQHEQMRCEKEREYLLSLMHALRDQRSKLQFLQNKGREFTPSSKTDEDDTDTLVEWERQREEAYGLAYACLLCVPDGEVQSVARDVMEETNPTEKLSAIDRGLARIGELVHMLYQTHH